MREDSWMVFFHIETCEGLFLYSTCEMCLSYRITVDFVPFLRGHAEKKLEKKFRKYFFHERAVLGLP